MLFVTVCVNFYKEYLARETLESHEGFEIGQLIPLWNIPFAFCYGVKKNWRYRQWGWYTN